MEDPGQPGPRSNRGRRHPYDFWIAEDREECGTSVANVEEKGELMWTCNYRVCTKCSVYISGMSERYMKFSKNMDL